MFPMPQSFDQLTIKRGKFVAEYQEIAHNKATMRITSSDLSIMVGTMITIELPKRTNPNDPFVRANLMFSSMTRLATMMTMEMNTDLEAAVDVLFHGELMMRIFPLYDKRTNSWGLDAHQFEPDNSEPVNTVHLAPTGNADMPWELVVGAALAKPNQAWLTIAHLDMSEFHAYVVHDDSKVKHQVDHEIFENLSQATRDRAQNFSQSLRDHLKRAKEKGTA